MTDFNSKLRHFIRKTERVDYVIQQNYLDDDDCAFGGDGDDWDSQVEALFASESDIEENEL